MVNLLEDPTPILLAGTAIEALLGIALLRTGRGALLVPMGGVVLLVLIGLAVERLVVTDVEQVENLIEAGRVAVESNNLPAALALVAPEAAEIQRRTREGFGEVKFFEVKVRGLTVKVNRAPHPMTAEVGFTVLATFESRHGTAPYGNYAATVTASLRRFGDRWRVTDVSDVQPGIGGQRVYHPGATRP